VLPLAVFLAGRRTNQLTLPSISLHCKSFFDNSYRSRPRTW